MRLVTPVDLDFLSAGFALDIAAPIILAITAILNLDYFAPVATPTAH